MLAKTKAIQLFLVKSCNITSIGVPFTDTLVVTRVQVGGEVMQATPTNANGPKNEYEMCYNEYTAH
jgi:hypothetical protein